MNKILLLFMVLVSMHANAQIVTINYTSTVPRSGFTEEVTVTKDSVFYQEYSKRFPNQKKLIKGEENNQWSAFESAIQKIDFSQINQLNAPTNKRLIDGAKYSELIFTTTDGNTFSHQFDDENPNEQFVLLLQEILRLK